MDKGLVFKVVDKTRMQGGPGVKKQLIAVLATRQHDLVIQFLKLGLRHIPLNGQIRLSMI